MNTKDRGPSKDRPCSLILSTHLLLVAMLLAGCATNRETATSPGAGNEISYWNDARSGGEPRIVIDLEQQCASFYRGDKIVGISPVSTGPEASTRPWVNSELPRKT